MASSSSGAETKELSVNNGSAISLGPTTPVNLFLEPHNRMKELVSWPLTEAAKVSDVHELEPSLQAIYEAMWEMKTHEYIENHYIMDQLKQRLQSRRVYNEVVCNCHEDSELLDVIALVESVYQASTQRERVKYGRRLQKAIKRFLHDFTHHMEEEEATFQPLLEENFNSNELKDMKEKVQEQHFLFRERVKSEKSLKALKRKRSDVDKSEELGFDMDGLRFKKSYCQEVKDFLGTKGNGSTNEKSIDEHETVVAPKKSKLTTLTPSLLSGEQPPSPSAKTDSIATTTNSDSSCPTTIDDMPEELLVVIFSHLNPKELLACGAINHRWRKVAFSSVFWKALYPTRWARGQWSFDYIPVDLKADDDLLMSLSSSSSIASSLSTSCESLSDREDNADENRNVNVMSDSSISKGDDRIFNGVGLHLLPRIGWSVSTMILSASKTLSDQHVQLILRQVPNVRSVNLSYTHISSDAFAGLNKCNALRKLEELVLSGCIRVGDGLFSHLAQCYSSASKPNRPSTRSKLKRLITSGCRSITSATMEHLVVHSMTLQELDLSGCWKIDGETLTAFVEKCSRLRPHKLAYCNDIEDGPFPDTANGCLNLECELRFCCQRLKN